MRGCSSGFRGEHGVGSWHVALRDLFRFGYRDTVRQAGVVHDILISIGSTREGSVVLVTFDQVVDDEVPFLLRDL